jgi:hypothetical protein
MTKVTAYHMAYIGPYYIQTILPGCNTWEMFSACQVSYKNNRKK